LELLMNDTVTLNPHSVPMRPAVRTAGTSLFTLVGIEMRKSLSTRSGKALAVASVGFAPAAMAIATATSEPIGNAVGPIAVMGMLTGFVLMALGVLATAGEWTHRTVQTTFLLVPSRGRVVTAKIAAVTLLGAAFAALSSTLASGVLFLSEPDLVWDGAGRAFVTVVAAGAAFAVTGGGVGAALGNTPAALTSLYLVILGVMPVLHNVKPEVATKIDPSNAVLNLAQGTEQTTSIAILSTWVVVGVAAGFVMTRRRAVQ
jgi:hypothetical protein